MTNTNKWKHFYPKLQDILLINFMRERYPEELRFIFNQYNHPDSSYMTCRRVKDWLNVGCMDDEGCWDGDWKPKWEEFINYVIGEMMIDD